MLGSVDAVGFTRLPLIIMLLASLSACSGGGESTTDSAFAETTTEVEYDHELTGSVGDGPIVGAAVRVVANDGTVMAEAQSDSSAGYNIMVRTKGKLYPLSIDAKGGTDLVTNLVPDFDMFGAVIDPGSKSVANLSPFSTFTVEMARNMPGGLSKTNLSAAEATVSSKLNSGLLSLAASGPMATPIDESNLAEIIKASETLGEIVRRVRDRQVSTGRSASGNSVVRSVAIDLVDGVVDGLGPNSVDARVAALTIVISAQTLLESMQNELHVNGMDATMAMEAAMNSVSATGSLKTLEDLVSTGDMLDAIRIGLEAALAVAPTPALDELAVIASSLESGMTPSMARSKIPDTYRQTLEDAILAVANGSDAEIETVNKISRDGGSSTAPPNGEPSPDGGSCTTSVLNWVNTFDQWSVGTDYRAEELASDYSNCSDVTDLSMSNQSDLFSVVDGGVNGSKALRIRFPAGSASEMAGKIRFMVFTNPQRTLNIEYYWKFEPGFYFVEKAGRVGGGKMPGLKANRTWSGFKADGSDWHIVPMWREHTTTSHRAILYGHYIDSETSPGGSPTVSTTVNPDLDPEQYNNIYPAFVENRWYKIRLQVKANSAPKNADGHAKIWIDDVYMGVQDNRIINWDDKALPNAMLIRAYYGGGSDWAAPNETYALLDNVRMWAGEEYVAPAQ